MKSMFYIDKEILILHQANFNMQQSTRGGEWYLEKRGSRKMLSGSRNLGSVYDKSRSLVFSWFVFTFLSLETFYQRVSGSDFLLGSRRLGESRILPFATPSTGHRGKKLFACKSQ